MPSYYIYLIASLPMLHFEIKPPFSFEQFLSICQEKISPSDFVILSTLSLTGEYAETRIETLRKWSAFETALRNELVRIRAARKRIDPVKYLREDGFTDPAIARIATGAYRNLDLLEAQRLLDIERWRKLDELAVGHYFDIDFLIVYAHKLLILERWERIEAADRPKVLEEVLGSE